MAIVAWSPGQFHWCHHIICQNFCRYTCLMHPPTSFSINASLHTWADFASVYSGLLQHFLTQPLMKCTSMDSSMCAVYFFGTIFKAIWTALSKWKFRAGWQMMKKIWFMYIFTVLFLYYNNYFYAKLTCFMHSRPVTTTNITLIINYSNYNHFYVRRDDG